MTVGVNNGQFADVSTAASTSLRTTVRLTRISERVVGVGTLSNSKFPDFFQVRPHQATDGGAAR
jgi:hypothetical protein